MKSFLLFFMFCFMIKSAFAIPAEVDYIFDGDTFAAKVLLEDDIKISVRVRLINVDTPEMNGECDYEKKQAERAKQKLSELIPVGTVVELDEIKDDKYLGRIDVRVFDKTGKDIGEELIRGGFGRSYSGGKRLPWCK